MKYPTIFSDCNTTKACIHQSFRSIDKFKTKFKIWALEIKKAIIFAPVLENGVVAQLVRAQDS